MSFLTVVTGPMGASKTDTARSMGARMRYGPRRVLWVKAAIDTLRSPRDISTHDGWHAPADIILYSQSDFRHLVEAVQEQPLTLFLLNEGQFIAKLFPAEDGGAPGFALACRTLCAMGADVVVTTLSKRHDGSPWPGIGELLCEADSIISCLAFCRICRQERAAHSVRRDAARAEQEVVLGDMEDYASLCRACITKYGRAVPEPELGG